MVFSYASSTWSKALISRLCWLDTGVFASPLALDAAGTLYQHETGSTAAGTEMPSFVISNPITVAGENRLADIDQFWPDMQEDSAACAVSMIARTYPGEAPYTHGPIEFAVSTEFVPFTVSAREVQLRIDGAGGFWKLGLPMISMQGGSLR